MNRKPDEFQGERIAKVMARAGLCSRRDAEAWIAAGRVSVNGKLIASPALNVSKRDKIVVDGKPLPVRERTRLFRYYKPRGLMTTNRDPEGRPTLFEKLPKELPRVVTVGRLDFNSEGLLLLTNDGGLARVLELPATGWLRRYRVRAKGRVHPEQLESLRKGVVVEGIAYGPMEAILDREQGSNVWLTVGLREGKNREVRKVLGSIGLEVNRLIRVSYGPFQLGDLKDGAVEEVKTAILREQISGSLAREAGADFDAPLREEEKKDKPPPKRGIPEKKPVAKPGFRKNFRKRR
jgi:23S rRNA pseudouridine2605 synthase